MMNLVNATRYSAFDAVMGDAFPYCHLRKTRQRYYCKYLFIPDDTARRPNNRPPKDGYSIIASNHFSPNMENEIIVSRKGFPLPPAYNFVGDVIRTWGRRVSPEWERFVYKYLWQVFNFTRPNAFSKFTLYKKCIQKLVFSLVEKHNLYNSGNRREVFFAKWEAHYRLTYTTVTEDFGMLAQATIQWFDERSSLVGGVISVTVNEPEDEEDGPDDVPSAPEVVPSTAPEVVPSNTPGYDIDIVSNNQGEASVSSYTAYGSIATD